MEDENNVKVKFMKTMALKKRAFSNIVYHEVIND